LWNRHVELHRAVAADLDVADEERIAQLHGEDARDRRAAPGKIGDLETEFTVSPRRIIHSAAALGVTCTTAMPVEVVWTVTASTRLRVWAS